jgi:AGCS family alanine or glycine:cation symporter
MRGFHAIAFALVLLLAAPVSAQEGEAEDQGGFVASVNRALSGVDAWFGEWIVAPMAVVFFYDVVGWDDGDDDIVARARAAGLSAPEAAGIIAAEGDARVAACQATQLSAGECKDVLSGISLPVIVLWLVLGAVFFTLRYGFISLRAFKHAIFVTMGRYDDPSDPGEVSHFQALSSALSATVGLGNIAGVAVAVAVGGPGAVFWLVVAGFLGMSSKFTECTLGQLYRQVDPSGRVSGGPMQYLARGLAELANGRLKTLGKVLAVIFAVMCVGGSFGGGNMFQANQSAKLVVGQTLASLGVESVATRDFSHLVYGILLAILTGVVIIGGIKRIGAVAGYIVPFMCGLYLLAGIAVLVVHASDVPTAFGTIVGQAFTPAAGYGGVLGVLVQGFRRAAFSNEAGIGSASIAHSAAATDEPVREGIVALLEPFIDTVVICAMTGIVLVVTGAYAETDAAGAPLTDVEMTRWAFDSVIPGFSWVLTPAVFFFAFSTMLSWSYYGERCFTYLFGTSTRVSNIYRFAFLGFVVLGPIIDIGNVITFSDLMILGMALPNILGLFILSNKVGSALSDYWKRYKSGEMQPNPAKSG